MKELFEQIAAAIGDYRAGELAPPDADHVGRWVSQFDLEEREPMLRELLHVWDKIYVGAGTAKKFLGGEITNANLTGGDHEAFWCKTEILDIQQHGHSQSDMLSLLKPILKGKTGLNLSDCGGGNSFLYIDDVLFTGNRIKNDLSQWIAEKAPAKATVYVLVMAVHTFGSFTLERDIKAAAQKAGKSITLKIFRLLAFENRKFQKDQSDVLWPAALPAGAAMYAQGATGHVARNPGGTSKLFSGEAGRSALEQGFLNAGMKIRGFCANPKPILRPLGFGPFGVGFGSLFLSYRNCPNNAALALWWGDPDAPPGHPFRKWYPLVPRKTYDGEDGF
jgi:hypothetical protein